MSGCISLFSLAIVGFIGFLVVASVWKDSSGTTSSPSPSPQPVTTPPPTPPSSPRAVTPSVTPSQPAPDTLESKGFHKWTRAADGHVLTARVLGIDSGIVTFQRLDGSVSRVPLGDLIPQDQKSAEWEANKRSQGR